MKALLGATVLLLVLAWPGQSAQWPSHATPGVPRTPEGEPDLEAPAPRTAWGTPDLSGIWQNGRGGGPGGGRGGRGRGRGGQPPQAPEAAPDAGPEAAPEGPPAPTFFDAGANFEDGLPFQPWAAELRAERVANNQKDNPDAHCLPIGFLQFHLHPQPRKIIQTPEEIVILYESNYGVREIFIDGRPLPDNDPQPWWYGYSVGRWEGDTLVVETTGFRDGGWLDVYGSPFTDEAHVTERFTRLNYGAMQIDITVDDPKAYTEPFTVRINHRIMLDTDLIEFICLENEQSSQFYDQ